MRVLMRSINFECRVSKYEKNRHPPMEPEFVQCQRYIAFSLSRDLSNCESLRPKSASVSITQETQDRPTISSAKRLAGALYIGLKKKKKKIIHRLSRLLWTSHPYCKRAGLIKEVNRSPGPPIYHALMLNASSVSSIRETVYCIIIGKHKETCTCRCLCHVLATPHSARSKSTRCK